MIHPSWIVTTPKDKRMKGWGKGKECQALKGKQNIMRWRDNVACVVSRLPPPAPCDRDSIHEFERTEHFCRNHCQRRRPFRRRPPICVSCSSTIPKVSDSSWAGWRPLPFLPTFDLSSPAGATKRGSNQRWTIRNKIWKRLRTEHINKYVVLFRLLGIIDGIMTDWFDTLTSEYFCDGQKCHGNEEVEEPVGRSSDAVARAPSPQWINLGVDSPRHRSHPCNEERISINPLHTHTYTHRGKTKN